MSSTLGCGSLGVFVIATPTPYLEGLILLATAYPVGWIRVAGIWWRPAAGPGQIVNLSASLIILLTVHAVLIAAVLAVAPWLLCFDPPLQGAWWAAGTAVAPLLVALEYVVGYVWLTLRKRKPGGPRLAGPWTGAGYDVMALTAAVAIGEEILFRQIWIRVLSEAGMGLPGVLALSALVYALNHLHFGLLTLLQKFASGWVLAWLYSASGGSVWIPMLAHVAQNLLVLTWGRTR